MAQRRPIAPQPDAERDLADARSRTPTVPVFTTALRPAASAYNGGLIIRVRDAAASQVQMCVQNSGGAWEWVLLATST